MKNSSAPGIHFNIAQILWIEKSYYQLENGFQNPVIPMLFYLGKARNGVTNVKVLMLKNCIFASVKKI